MPATIEAFAVLAWFLAPGFTFIRLLRRTPEDSPTGPEFVLSTIVAGGFFASLGLLAVVAFAHLITPEGLRFVGTALESSTSLAAVLSAPGNGLTLVIGALLVMLAGHGCAAVAAIMANRLARRTVQPRWNAWTAAFTTAAHGRSAYDATNVMVTVRFKDGTSTSGLVGGYTIGTAQPIEQRELLLRAPIVREPAAGQPRRQLAADTLLLTGATIDSIAVKHLPRSSPDEDATRPEQISVVDSDDHSPITTSEPAESST